jgi:hypothetical protein
MADPDFTNRAAQLAVSDAERELITASRAYEDAQRDGDEITAAVALRDYAASKKVYDALTGADQPRQQQPGLSNAQRNFLSRRAALGDELTPSRMRDYSLAHTRAVNAGLQPDTPQYFAAVERSVDTMGDGRQPVLDEREAARMCGIDERTYAQNAAKLRAMRLAGQHD